MSITLGNLLYFIKMNNSEVRQKTEETGKVIKDLGAKFNDSKKVIKQWGQDVKNSIKQVNDFAQKNKEAIQAVAIVSGAALAGLTLEIRKAVKENNEFKNAMIGLRSVAKGVGVDIDAVTKAAKELTADGLMSVSDAATGLKNLLLAGFGLDQAVILMNRFKDSAAFGRQGALSFGEAIRSATEGIKNGNSVLVDNAGITKNLSVMLQEAGYSAQDLMKASDDVGVRMAIFNGIIKETRHQVGDAAKLAGTFSGALSKSEENMRRLHRALGDALEGPLANWLNKVNDITTKTAEWVENNKELAGTLTLTATGLAAAVLGGATFLLSLDKIIKVLKMAKTLLLDMDVIFAIRWVAAGGRAAEAIGFLAKSFSPFLVGGVIILGLATIVKLINDIKTGARNAQIATMDLSKATVDELTVAVDYWQKTLKQLNERKAELEKKIQESSKKPAHKQAYTTPTLVGISVYQVTVKDELKWNKEALDRLEAQITEAQNKLTEAQNRLSAASAGKITCPYCGQTLKTDAELESHIKSTHSSLGQRDAEAQNELLNKLRIERLERLKQFKEAEIEEEELRYKEELKLAKNNDALIEEVKRSHKERLAAIDEKYSEQERQRNQELTDGIIRMTGTKEEQEELYIKRRAEQMERDGYNFKQIEDWKAAYRRQKLQEQAAYEADWISSIITRQRTLEDWWRELMNNLVREYVQNFLLKIKAANAATGSDTSFWGAIFSAIGSLFGGGAGAAAGAGAGAASGATIPAAAKGMIVPAAANGMIVPPSFGTDKVLSALTPKEMVLPPDISEGLQNLIRQGSQPQIVNNNITNNYIDAIDQQSVAQFFYKNRDYVVGIVQDNQRRGGALRRSEE